MGDITVGLTHLEPGWRWSDDVDRSWWRRVRSAARGRRAVGTFRSDHARRDDCRVRAERCVRDPPPGHDGFVVGDEPCAEIEWAGLRAFAGFRLLGVQPRALVTLLFTDIVESTAMVARIGDGSWALTYFRRTSRRRGKRSNNIKVTRSTRRETACSRRSSVLQRRFGARRPFVASLHVRGSRPCERACWRSRACRQRRPWHRSARSVADPQRGGTERDSRVRNDLRPRTPRWTPVRTASNTHAQGSAG